MATTRLRSAPMLAGAFAGVTSDAWVVIGVVVTLVGVPLTVWSQFASSRRKRTRLEWSAPIHYQLVSRAADLLEIRLRGQTLGKPFVVHINLRCVGSSDIPSVSFDRLRPLKYDLGAQIVTQLDVDHVEHIEPPRISGQTIEIDPFHFPAGAVVRLAFVVDGHPTVRLTSAHLVDIDVVEASLEPTRRTVNAQLTRLIALVATLTAMVLGTHSGSPVERRILLAVALAGLVAMVWDSAYATAIAVMVDRARIRRQRTLRAPST